MTSRLLCVLHDDSVVFADGIRCHGVDKKPEIQIVPDTENIKKLQHFREINEMFKPKVPYFWC